MSDRLEAAFREASKLTAAEQDQFAEFILAELEDDRAWTQKFEQSQDMLSVLAREARAEYNAGKTEPLDDLLK